MPPVQAPYHAPLAQDSARRREREPPQNPLSQERAAPAYLRRRTAEEHQLAPPSYPRRSPRLELRCQRRSSDRVPLHDLRVLAEPSNRSQCTSSVQ